MGCMAQREKDDLLKKYPHVDLVVGTDQFVNMPELLKRIDEGERLAATDFGDFEDRNWNAIRTEGINAWVPVMRGCNYNCTYCIVPKTRGREKSRRPELIEEEIRSAVAKGATSKSRCSGKPLMPMAKPWAMARILRNYCAACTPSMA